MESEWQKSQGRYRIRHKLLESMDSRDSYEIVSHEENSSKGNTAAAHSLHRSVLVRDFEFLLRRCDALNSAVTVTSAPDQKDGTESALWAAWLQYKKISEHPDSRVLLTQIRPSATALFITELNFATASLDYRKRFDQIIRVFDDYSNIGRPITNHLLFGIYLRALNKVGKHRLVFKAIPEFYSYTNSSSDSVLPPNIVRQLIAAYFGVNRADKAFETFDILRKDRKHKSTFTPHVYVEVIRGAIRTNHLSESEIHELVDELLELLDHWKHSDAASTGILNELLDAVKASANRSLFFWILERFISQGTGTNYATFGIVLKSLQFLRPGTKQMKDIYDALISHEQSRNAMTQHVFGVFINNFVNNGMINDALSALQDMRNHPTASPTILNMSLLFKHYAAAGLAQQSLALYHTMLDVDKLTPTWVIYMSIVKAISKYRHLDKVSEIADDMTKRFDGLLMLLINHGQVGDFDQMFDAFDKLREIAPNSLLPFAAVFVKSYYIAKQRARLIRYGPEATTRLGAGIPDDAENQRFVGLLRACLDSLFKALSDQPGIRDLYNMIISTFATLRDYESTQRAYDHMTKIKHLEPNSRTFNVLIQSYVRNFDLDTATDVLEELKAGQVPLNHVTFNVLIRGYSKAGLVDQAIDAYAYMVGRPSALLDSAEFKDFVPCATPDDYLYAFLISALIDSRRYKEAIIVFEDSFSTLPFVPRQLLEALVGRLEESLQFALSLQCLKRYTKRVEDCQPAPSQITLPDGKHAAVPEPSSDRLPATYFGYASRRDLTE
ncbi:hypothetical protein GGI12_001944 [Dipsacomyces acuminosporus]|nr:hypothetical protein GGI12_001944 [Dipsacomyces acuminosporus]